MIVFSFDSKNNRETPILWPSFLIFYSLYHDIPPFPIWSMNPSEILAEKIRELMYRKKARDLFDVYFLIRKGIIHSVINVAAYV